MLKSFTIDHFRGYKKFALSDLKLINLVGGLNNVGKTSLLEALYIHAGFGNAELLLRTNFWRGLVPTSTTPTTAVQDFIGASFFNYETLTPIVFESVDRSGRKRQSKVLAATPWDTKVTSTIEAPVPTPSELPPQQRLGLTLNLAKLVFEEDESETQTHNLLLNQLGTAINVRVDPTPKPPTYPCHFLHTAQPYRHSDDATIFSALRQEGKDALVLEALQGMDASLNGIEVLTPGGTPTLFVRRNHGRLLPLPYLGDGAVRLANIILKIALSSLGVVLIDEWAFGFHYTVLEPIWKVLHQAAKRFDTQLICTTHSFEAIEAAYRAFRDTPSFDDFGYIRLERVNDEVKPIPYDRDSLSFAIENHNEVR